MYYYKKTKETLELSKEIDKNIETFKKLIKNDKNITKNIISIGIIGPLSRNQGFYFNNKIKSDLDIYVIRNTINSKFNEKLKEYFNKSFNKKLDASLLLSYKSIFKKPDLMYFEYSHSKKIFYGQKPPKIKIKDISRFEGFRNIIYRSAYFLNLFEIKNNKIKIKKNIPKEEFLYHFSKIIFAYGEIKLILNKKYKADNFERNKLILEYNGQLSKLHNIMHQFRYENKIPSDFNLEKYTTLGFLNIEYSFNYLFKNLVELKELKTIHPQLLNRIVNKLIFIKRYFSKYKKIKINKEEDFIILLEKVYNFVKKINTNKKLEKKELEEILFYWKNAGWFYYKL